MSKLNARYFHDANAARRHLEAIRWPNGPICPHCGEDSKVWKIKSKSTRPGLYKCGNKICRKQFTVTVGTLFERSHVPLHLWFQAAYLLCSSKKGFSAHQLHRLLGVRYQTAWFMAHRLREAMKDGNLFPEPMGGAGEIVQADETYYGRKDTTRGKSWKDKKGHSKMRPIVTLISGGKARTFHVKHANAKTVRNILVRNVSRESELHTDESRLYTIVGEEFARHRRVIHARGQYVGPSGETTNAVENYFSVFKRGMRGTYQHCAEKHLQRYVNEFDFRYNSRAADDLQRTMIALYGIGGKRLMYRHS